MSKGGWTRPRPSAYCVCPWCAYVGELGETGCCRCFEPGVYGSHHERAPARLWTVRKRGSDWLFYPPEFFGDVPKTAARPERVAKRVLHEPKKKASAPPNAAFVGTAPVGTPAAAAVGGIVRKARQNGTSISLATALSELLGQEAADKLIAEFGGARIWVPVQNVPGSKLAELLSEAAASALGRQFGGNYLHVPKKVESGDVHRRIAELHRQGSTIDDIALAVGRSRRTVFRLLEKKIVELRLS